MRKDIPGKDFELLYRTKKPRLVAYARRFTDTYAEACDIVQDSFLKMWLTYPDYNPSSAEALIFTITRNCCIDNLKRKKLFKGIDLSFLECLEGDETIYNFDFLGPSAHDECLLNELNAQLEELMNSLPQRCRQVFRMSRMEGMTNSQIASALGISLPAVTKHINRALSYIAGHLNEINASPYVKLLIFLFFFSARG